jgi:hypothetical protein
MRTLVGDVQTYLEANTTDFAQALSAGTHFEGKQDENAFTTVKDWFIQWKSN